MNTIRWVIPEAREPASDGPRDSSAPASIASGRQLRIGLLDNTKDNARLLLELIGERVREEFKAEVVWRRKGNATVPATAEVLDELALEADVVLTAMAD